DKTLKLLNSLPKPEPGPEPEPEPQAAAPPTGETNPIPPPAAPNQGLNSPCHCGSGLKFKRCCGRVDRKKRASNQ
ncbi:MAG: SEC-C domain-containing protein, partial [Bryobacteraceae bacterium]|nr:SEC-C domain-containing protein [Bryobacteraceae bacterium]